MDFNGEVMGEILLYVIYAIVGFIISSAVHELGHILIGLIQGFKFYLFIAGPFGIKRKDNDKIKFYIEKDISLWGGLGATIPVNEDRNNFKKFGRILLGGPISSLFFGALCLAWGLNIENIFLGLTGAMAVGMGVACLIPARNGAFYTDGGRWLRMYKNPETKEIEIAIWNITQSSIIKGNYLDANMKDIEVLTKDKDLRTKYLGHYYAYYYYKDNNDLSGAEREKSIIESLKNQVPKQMITMFPIK